MRIHFLIFLLAAAPAFALDKAAVEKLATGETDERAAAIAALVAEADPKAASFLQAVAEGEVQIAGKRVLIVKGGQATDAVTGEKVDPIPEGAEDVVANNRLRKEIDGALAAFKLLSPDRAIRFAAAKELAGGADAAMLPLVKKALDKEADPQIKSLLEVTAASMEMTGGTKDERIAAIRRLGESNSPNSRTVLSEAVTDKDEDIRIAAQKALLAVQGKLAWGERAGLLFAGISLGSILLLAALGLAITYGLMGVINMAHGELIMIGAYTTYVVQIFFRKTDYFDWYLLAAVPASFVVAAAVGMVKSPARARADLGNSTAGRATLIFNEVMAKFDITPTQFAALAKIDDEGAISQNHLGRLTAMDPSTILGVVGRLQRQGLVHLRSTPGDARLTLIELTLDGQKRIAEMKALAAEVSKRTLAPLKPADAKTLTELLARIG